MRWRILLIHFSLVPVHIQGYSLQQRQDYLRERANRLRPSCVTNSNISSKLRKIVRESKNAESSMTGCSFWSGEWREVTRARWAAFGKLNDFLIWPPWTIAARLRSCQNMADEISIHVQRSGKVDALRLVNFVPAVAYHHCLNLPAAFTQSGALTFANLCKIFA